MSNCKVALSDLLTNEKYRKMDIKDLTFVIDYEISFADYLKLRGDFAAGKAENLFHWFKFMDMVD